MYSIQIKNVIIELIKGDITKMNTDAIVNAANEHLAHGGGVAGAISRAGGRDIQNESNDWIKKHGLVKTGSAAITSAGNLAAKYIIHAVGPIMGSGDEDEKLKKATLSSLELADRYQLQSIAFPAISTGIFGYPLDRCANVMLNATIAYSKEKTGLKRIVFCLWGNDAFSEFITALEGFRKKSE